MSSRKPVIAGYGESNYHKKDHDAPIEYLYNAVKVAIRDSKIPHADIDGLALHSITMDEANVFELAFHFGIESTWLFENELGNASSVGGLVRAAQAIEDGAAEAIVVAAGDAYSTTGNYEAMGKWHFLSNYMEPFGHGGANSTFGFVQRRHMHEHGTTRKQLSNIAVTQREHALANPNAIFDDPLTTEDYLNARPIVDPIHLYDCVYPCGGGGALVVTTQENAEELGTEYVDIVARAEYHHPDLDDLFGLQTGLKHCHQIYEEANLTHSDIDAVQLYDNYPIMVTIQLEDLGFCAKGEGGEFISETDLSVNGELPLNTGGGQLSQGQAGGAGGILPAIEAVRQLRNDGGERQVADCENVLATGFGNITYGSWSSAATILSNGEGA